MITDCERLRADAPGLAALPPDDPERSSAWAHALRCPGCARALREGERLQGVLGEWHPAPLSGAALHRAARAVELELQREGRRRSLWSAAAAVASMAALVGLSRQRGGSGLDWAVGAALAGLAIVLAALSRRAPRFTLALAVAAAVAAALVAGGPGSLDMGEGVRCLAAELGSAALVVGAAWMALRGGTTALTPSTRAAAAAAGALAGDAALQIACRAHEVGPHLLAFHVGGVILAAIAAWLWLPRRSAVAAV
jgi:hypothetical protein